MAKSIPAQTLSVVAAGTITKRRFVTAAGVQAGAAANTLGVARTDALSGEDLAVDNLGTTEVEAGAAIALGAAIETSASGKAVARAAGPTVARALQAAAGDGSVIEVVLIPN